MTDESIDEEEDEVWSHGHDGEVGGPELLFAALDEETKRTDNMKRASRQDKLYMKLMSMLLSKFY